MLRRLGKIAAVLAALWFAFELAFPNHTHRYRLAIEVNTPDGLRSGSSVIEVESADNR